VHFSDLKKFADSAAHYRESISNPFKATRAMRIGTIVHRELLGGERLAVWEGQRRGKAWEKFRLEHEGSGIEIVTETEVDEARLIAEAIRANPRAMARLIGRHEVPLTWRMGELPCRTRGIDVVGDGWIADLKITNSAQPDRWRKQAIGMLYHAQMAFYEEAARQNKIDTSKGVFLVGVESKPPFPSTVLRLSARALEEGRKCIGLWLGQLEVCLSSNEWPEYVQSEIELDVADEGVGLTIGGKAFSWEDDDEAA
jgi:hypothetical protein